MMTSNMNITHNKDVTDITVETHKNIFSLLEPHINKNPKGVFMYQHNIHVAKKTQKNKCSDEDILANIINDCDTSSSFALLIRLLLYLTQKSDHLMNTRNDTNTENLLKQIINLMTIDPDKQSKDPIDNEWVDGSHLIKRLSALNVDCSMISRLDLTISDPLLKNAIIDRIRYMWRQSNGDPHEKHHEADLFADLNDMIKMCVKVSWDFSPDSKSRSMKYECKNSPDISESLDDNEWIEYECSDPSCVCRKIKTKHRIK